MKSDYFSEDIQDFIRLLALHAVRYVIVGGEAVIYHGYARLTGDVDFYYEPSQENAGRLFRALMDFWQSEPPGIESDAELAQEGTIFQFGVPPNRIDLINKIDGVSFEECWNNRVAAIAQSAAGTVQVAYIGLDQLIKNKEASGRPKDIDDLRYLKRQSHT